MKIEVQSKKGLKTTFSIFIDKKSIKKEMDQKLIELQTEVVLKGFRQGKVPPDLIKKQFGKAIYGEVIDKLLKESSAKAIQQNKLRIAGQPKIDLKTFGEGKDLNYELQIETFPEINLKNFKNFQAVSYNIVVEKKIIDERINQLSKQNKNFFDKKSDGKAEKGDLVIFNYSATLNGKKFDGSEGKNVQLELGSELFLKGFDNQLIGSKKNGTKLVKANLPPNLPNKDLANKPAEFNCTILSVKFPGETKIDDNFAKNMGAKNLEDLKSLVTKQIISQYKQSLDSITKKSILYQIEKSHNISIPENLIQNELGLMTQNLKKEEKEKHKKNNTKIASSRIKLGLILNEYGEKNELKISEQDINNEIQKQVAMSPGQEKIIADYYKKNPQALQSLKGMLFENKIIEMIKSEMKLDTKNINTKEAEKIIIDFNKKSSQELSQNKSKITKKSDQKSKKISKK